MLSVCICQDSGRQNAGRLRQAVHALPLQSPVMLYSPLGRTAQQRARVLMNHWNSLVLHIEHIIYKGAVKRTNSTHKII